MRRDKCIKCPYTKNDNCFARSKLYKEYCYLLETPCVDRSGKIKEECPFYKSKGLVEVEHREQARAKLRNDN